MARKDSNGNPLGKSRGLRRRTGGVADWATANAEIIKSAIEAASLSGGALRFGYTTDGGAYSVGIYGDGDPYTVYVSPNEDLDIILEDVRDLFQAITDERREASNGAQVP